MIGLVLVAAAAAAPTSVDTPQGFRFGAAKAPSALVQYGSPNCPHCAHFASFGMPEIAKRVRTGKLSFEYRPFLIFPHDLPATLIAKCVPASRKFGFIEDYYRNTAAVTERVQALPVEELEAARGQGAAALNRKLVAAGQMKPIAARFGLTPAAVDRCVSDPKNIAWLDRIREAGQNAGVTSTPTFFLNGQRVRLNTPEDLRSMLGQ